MVKLVNLVTDITHDSVLISRDLPFVVKLPLATSGYGTWLVTTEPGRHKMLAGITKFMSRGGTEVLVSAYVNTSRTLASISLSVLRGMREIEIIPLSWLSRYKISPQAVTGRAVGSITAHNQHLKVSLGILCVKQPDFYLSLSLVGRDWILSLTRRESSGWWT